MDWDEEGHQDIPAVRAVVAQDVCFIYVRPTKSNPNYALAAFRQKDDSRRSGLIVIRLLYAFDVSTDHRERTERNQTQLPQQVLEPPRQVEKA